MPLSDFFEAFIKLLLIFSLDSDFFEQKTNSINETLGVVENSIFAFDTLRSQLAGTTSNSQRQSSYSRR